MPNDRQSSSCSLGSVIPQTLELLRRALGQAVVLLEYRLIQRGREKIFVLRAVDVEAVEEGLVAAAAVTGPVVAAKGRRG